MYQYKTKIYLRDTDATGVLFFAEQMRIALEGFESFLIETGNSVRKILESNDYLTPVVHSEADYLAPLMVGDEVIVIVSLGGFGTSSFTIQYSIYCGEELKGKVSTVHVTVDKKTFTKIPLPKALIEHLNKLA